MSGLLLLASLAWAQATEPVFADVSDTPVPSAIEVAVLLRDRPVDASQARRLLAFTEGFPTHRSLPEVWYAIGRFHQEQGDLFKASHAYDRASNALDHPIWPRASVELAACRYEMGHYEDALALLKEVVRRSHGTLEDAVLHELARRWLVVSPTDEAEGYFRARGRADLSEWVRANGRKGPG